MLENDKVLGKGSFGEVVFGFSIGQKPEPFAVKRYKKSALITEFERRKFYERLNEEKNTLYSIDSPNVVKLLGSASSDEYEYLLLEFCNGGNLRNYIYCRDKYHVIPDEEAIYFLKQIMTGFFNHT